MRLDDRALFLGDDHQIQPLGPVAETLGLQWPDHPNFVSGYAEFFTRRWIEAEQIQSMGDVEPGFAGGDDADPRAGLAMDAAIDAVCPRKGLGGEALVIMHPRFLGLGGVAEADIEAALGHLERGGELHPDPFRIAIDDRGGLHGILHAFQTNPAARIAAERPAQRAVVQHLLHAGGREDGHHGIHQRHLGLMAGGGALAGMVVAHGHHHAAQRRGAGEIGVAEDIAGAVHAGALAVPERKDAVMRALAAQLRLLGAPDGRGGEILVQARIELDTSALASALWAPWKVPSTAPSGEPR